MQILLCDESRNYGFSGHVTWLFMHIFSNTGYMNFDKNLIHSAITPFHNDSDAEKIRKIHQELTKCSSDKGFFVNSTLLYNIDEPRKIEFLGEKLENLMKTSKISVDNQRFNSISITK